MLRRSFLQTFALAAMAPATAATRADKLVSAVRNQVGVTMTYDPTYTSIPYPNGDVSRSTGVCADVVIRAYRDALALDLQQLVHEDMAADFAAYPRAWGARGTDRNIDHRRVLNLETFWRRRNACVWSAAGATVGDAFPKPLKAGDLVTWMLDAKLPHVGVIVAVDAEDTRLVHNIGGGAQEISLAAFAAHRAKGHYRWETV